LVTPRKSLSKRLALEQFKMYESVAPESNRATMTACYGLRLQLFLGPTTNFLPLHILYSSPSIITMIKLSRMILAWYAARIGEKKN
jgi:hypothetical protein